MRISVFLGLISSYAAIAATSQSPTFYQDHSHGWHWYETQDLEADQSQEEVATKNPDTDTEKKKAIYSRIDSFSYEASKWAIPNEYDKMVSSIGAKGTNAFTDRDLTCYVNDIPSNALDKWLFMESDRFQNLTLRIFHTELEAVYEEFNISTSYDQEWSSQAVDSLLMPNHPYGSQTTIGLSEHLKNPSLLEIRKYFEKYYVPNNMCMILAGDFDPDAVIKKVDEKFGFFVPKDVTPYIAPKEADISTPVEKTVYGPKDEWVSIGYRFPGASSEEAKLLQVADRILANGTAGLLDINLNQNQKVLEAVSYAQTMKDYSIYELDGKPKEGQTLAEVKSLLLNEIENLKKGNFDEGLLQAVKNNFEKEKLQKMELNINRANNLLDGFIKEVSWKDELAFYEEVKQFTKSDIIAFANKWFGNNYVVVYKKNGKDTSILKVAKPPIHEVEVNRNAESDFVKQIAALKTEDIKPIFLDFKKDIQQVLTNKVPLIISPNNENQLFSLYYYFDMGSNNLKKLPLALEYLKYLGTNRYTAEEINKEFYKVASSFSTHCDQRTTYIQVDGLNKNLSKSIELLEHLLANCQPDQNKLDAFINDYIKTRENDKLVKYNILNGLVNIATYGIKNPFNYKLSDAELKKLRAEELVTLLHNLTKYRHKVLYYGPEEKEPLVATLAMYHKTNMSTRVLPSAYPFTFRKNTANEVNFANYDMVQTEISWSRNSAMFSPVNIPVINLFNEYFGGGMAGVVFQTIRESKALAYSTYAYYGTAYKKNEPNIMKAYVGCQADKMNESILSMQELLDSLPFSEKLFSVTKASLKNNFATSRILKQQILFKFLEAQRLGISYDTREKTYQLLDKFTFDDLKAFHQTMVAKKAYFINIIGDEKKVKTENLSKYGKVSKYTLKQIFGY